MSEVLSERTDETRPESIGQQTELGQAASEQENRPPSPSGPLEEPGREWFVNRTRDLELFWKWGTNIPGPLNRSRALIGLRRTGKSVILHKTFNRLFHEQTRVLPVFITFSEYLHRPTPINSYEFADTFVGGYVKSYLAFRYRLPHLFRQKTDISYLREFSETYQDERLIEIFKQYQSARYGKLSSVHQLIQWAISVPNGFAQPCNQPTAVFIDEFQILTWVYNPDSKVYNSVANAFQPAAEANWAPLLVSGSSVSMMVHEALGGLLSGRFKPRHLGPLTEEHAINMAFRLGSAKGIPMTQELAVAISTITKGYPYSIECLLNSDSSAVERLPNLDALNEIVTYELTREEGALWQHYENEYGKYVRQLNGDKLARKILLWSTNHPDEQINSYQVATTFGLEWEPVQEALEKLYRLDVIGFISGNTYTAPKDPLMREFLRQQHYLDIENVPKEDVVTALRQQLNAKQGEINYQAGHFTEIIVAGLLNNYDDRTVAGKDYFGTDDLVNLPIMNRTLRRDGVIKAGAQHEIDVVGEYHFYGQGNQPGGTGAWLVSVRYRGHYMGEWMGVNDVEEFIRHAEAYQAEKNYVQVIRWYFSKTGFTEAAAERMQAEGIYFSDLQQFNALATLFGLLRLSM